MIRLKDILIEACWKGYKQVGMKDKGGKQVPNCVPESFDGTHNNLINELTFKDLLSKRYKYVIGSGYDGVPSDNPKDVIISRIENTITHYLFDWDFYYNWINDDSDKKLYKELFKKMVLSPMMKNIDKTLSTYFEIYSDKYDDYVAWKDRKYPSAKSRKFIDTFFQKTKQITPSLKKDYYNYRSEYFGVKLKEDLRKWFGSGKTGGWDRYNTKGEKVGKCGDAEEGEPYVACLSNEKAAKLGKDGRAAFVKRKRDAQKKAGDAKKGGEQSKGQKPTFVKTGA